MILAKLAVSKRVATVSVGNHLSICVSQPARISCRDTDQLHQRQKASLSNTSTPSSQSIPFRPRRRAPKQYRPFQVKKVEKEKPFFNVNDNRSLVVNIGEVKDAKDEMEARYGRHIAELIKAYRREQKTLHNDPFNMYDPLEENIRDMDFLTAEKGSTEELIYLRRSYEHYTPEEIKEEESWIEDTVMEAEREWLMPNFTQDEIRKLRPTKPKKSEAFDHLFDSSEEDILYSPDDEDQELRNERGRQAHGNWSEYLVDLSRGTHNWRGGRVDSFRAMVIGGNGNGCGGFGVGQSDEPMKAMEIAARKGRRNIFFVDRFHQEGITRDLVGRQNNCKAVIRQRKDGLKGNALMCEILMRFGISAAACKVYGNRHPWNMVYATFKALQTHESMEEIAMKRGKRLLAVERSIKVGV